MVKTMPAGEAKAAGLFREIGQEIDDAYMEELKKQSIHPEVIREMAKDFTSSTRRCTVPAIFRCAGFCGSLDLRRFMW